MPPKLTELYMLSEAAREEVWAELEDGRFNKGTAVPAEKGSSFEQWARQMLRKRVGKNDRLKRAEPPRAVFGKDAEATAMLQPVEPSAGVTYVSLSVPSGAHEVNGVKISGRKPAEPLGDPQSPEEAFGRVKKAKLEQLPKKIAWEWEDFWLDGGGQAPKDAKFAVSVEGHAAALVGKDLFFYDQGWVPGEGNDAAKAQAGGMLGMAGYDVRRLMPPPDPRWFQPGMLPPGARR